MTFKNTKLIDARAYVIDKAPYFSSVIYGFIPYAIEGMKTMGVTKGMVLVYDPEWVETLSNEECGAALGHECMHVLDDTFGRGEGKDPQLFNLAADLPINDSLRDAHWTLPSFACYPEKFGLPKNLTAEEYYEKLLERAEKASGGQAEDQKGKGGKGKKKGQGQGQGQGQTPGAGPPGPSPTAGEGQVCAGRCGSAGGHGLDSDLEKQLDEAHGRSEADKKRIQFETAEKIQAHAASKGRGSLPAYLEQWAKTVNAPPKIRWQSIFAQVARKCTGRIEAGGHDYSFARPAKRSFTRGLIRPSLVQQTPIVLFVLDTSGSMGDQQISYALREMVGILKTCGVEDAFLIQADAGISEDVRRIQTRDLTYNFRIKGRGGTDFRPAIERAKTMRPKPDILVYLTDGDGYADKDPPAGFEVIWAVIQGHYNKSPVGWGHFVKIDETG